MHEKFTDYYPTKYWHLCEDGRVQCDICPRKCKLKNGQRGLCFVRACENNQIVLLTFARSSGFCIDPIEKKPLNHFFPGTPVLSFGTAGCNLACKFCQNWDISKSREMASLADAASPEALAKTAKKLRCQSIAFTYNDPVIFMEYAIEVAKACHHEGIKTVAVSAGYIEEEPRREFFAHIDATNIDLKAFTEKFYWQLTGGHLQNVLDTLIYIHKETDTWLEITTLLIPGENDSNNEIEQMCRWIRDNLGSYVPLHFSAFHPDYKMTSIPPTPLATLKRAREIAIKSGLKYVYTGNAHDPQGQSTYCANCNNLLIERDWYQLGQWNLDKQGQCQQCGSTLHGEFAAQPGQWGAQRLPVTLSAHKTKQFN